MYICMYTCIYIYRIWRVGVEGKGWGHSRDVVRGGLVPGVQLHRLLVPGVRV